MTLPPKMGVTMKRLRTLALLTIVAALSAPCFAGVPVDQTPPAPGQTAGPAATASGPSKVCLDVQTGDKLMEQFAERLRETIAASGTMRLAPPADSCNLQLHVPGNLLRFQTAGGVMVSTVVIVTSSSGRYLSTSITACQASDLGPCAVRAVAAAKLALLVGTDEGS